MRASLVLPQGRMAAPGVRLPVMVAALLGILTHVPSLPGGFVFDDAGYVLQNPDLREWRRLPHVLAVSSHHHLGMAGAYRPITALSWGLDMLTWGRPGGEPSPVPFHATNVLLHGAACALVAALLSRLAPLPVAAAGAALFAVHPVHVEAVAWISGRAEILGLSFCAAALLAMDLPGRASRLGATGLLSLLAYGSKESAFLLPAFMVMARLRRRGPRGGWDAVALASCLLGAVVTVRWLILMEGVPIVYEFQGARPVERVHVALSVLAVYARLLAWPWPLTAEYHWAGGVPPGLAALGALVLLAVAPLVALRATRPHGLCALLVVVALLPVMHLNPLGELLAERFLYTPSVGFCLLVASAVALPRRSAARAAWVGVALLVAAGAAASAAQCRTWRDEEALFGNAVRWAPDSPLALRNLAIAHLTAGRPELAVPHWRRLVELGEANTGDRYNLAVFLVRKGQLREALQALGPPATFRVGTKGRRLRAAIASRLAGSGSAGGMLLPSWPWSSSSGAGATDAPRGGR